MRGSAWKRKTYFSNDKLQTTNAITEACNNYQAADLQSQKKDAYSYINLATLHNILVLGGKAKWEKETLRGKKPHKDFLLTIKEIISTLSDIENENSYKALSADYGKIS